MATDGRLLAIDWNLLTQPQRRMLVYLYAHEHPALNLDSGTLHYGILKSNGMKDYVEWRSYGWHISSRGLALVEYALNQGLVAKKIIYLKRKTGKHFAVTQTNDAYLAAELVEKDDWIVCDKHHYRWWLRVMSEHQDAPIAVQDEPPAEPIESMDHMKEFGKYSKPHR